MAWRFGTGKVCSLAARCRLGQTLVSDAFLTEGPAMSHGSRIALLALAAGVALGSGQGDARAQAVTVSGQRQAFTGEPISVELRDGQLADLLRLIAKVAGLNLVLDPSVSGKTITLDLRDVPWDQALDLVLTTHGLSGEIDGNVLRVVPTSQLTLEGQQKAQLQSAREAAGELRTYVRRLNWASASAVEPIVRKTLTARGTLTVDKRTNSLIIEDVFPPSEALLDAIDPPGAPGASPGLAGSASTERDVTLEVAVYEMAPEAFDSAAGPGDSVEVDPARLPQDARLVGSARLEGPLGRDATLDLDGGRSVGLSPQRDGARTVLTFRGADGTRGWLVPDGAHAGVLARTDSMVRLLLARPVI